MGAVEPLGPDNYVVETVAIHIPCIADVAP